WRSSIVTPILLNGPPPVLRMLAELVLKSEVRGHALGLHVGRAEDRVEDAGPLQVEVGVDIPREAHAAVDLDTGLAVDERGLAGDELGPRHRPGRVAHAGVVEGHPGGVDGGAR